MALFKSTLWVALLTAAVTASPIAFQPRQGSQLLRRQDDNATLPYSLPGSGLGETLRQAAIITKRATFLYGPGIGGGPSSPTGPLGLTYIAVDSALTDTELTAQAALDTIDTAKATADIGKYDGLQTLDDYTQLYNGEWGPSMSPTGVDPGMLTNYTQDILFSMERLSFNPYAVRRLIPNQDNLPFTISDATAQNITGQTLSSLLSGGQLFYSNFTDQAQLPRTSNYAAACDAYFYISKTSNEFLPLAIRTNFGSNLIYTPADSANDWLLAKLMYNVNDFFMGQFHHLANTHFVTEVAYQAAIRTLSDEHPVMAIFARLMYGAFGIRPLAVAVLFRPGGSVDQFFGFSGTAAADYAETLYLNGYAGAVQSNYFLTNLQKRGLLDSSVGPALKDFPFYEDASVIYNAIRSFMGTFVDSYYANNDAIKNDGELQAWLVEAAGPAGSIDFPSSSTLQSPSDLADLLAHMAHLVSSSHHAVNTNQLITGSGVLPFNPSALYKQIPTSKGVQNVAEYLPPVLQCVGMINNQADFARPLLAATNRTLVHMFDDEQMLALMNEQTKSANTQFMSAMMAQSQVVSSRTFDGNGLSQGMPFVWKALDPNVAPFSLTI